MNNLPRHGSAEDRGSADYYYWRSFNPHYYIGNSYSSRRVELKPINPEYKLYRKGWEEETDRKDWG